MSKASRERSRARKDAADYDYGEWMERMERMFHGPPGDVLDTRSLLDSTSVARDYCRDCELAVAIVRRVHPDPGTKWSPHTADVSWEEAERPGGVYHAYDSQRPESYHHRFADRIRWVRAWDQASAPPLVYLAHPVLGDFRANIASARRWLRWLRSLTLDGLRALGPNMADLRELPAVGAPWLAEPFDGDSSPDFRRRHMAGCRAMAARHDEVWVAVRWSPGVSEEARASRKVRDLTHLGPTPWVARRG